MASDSSDCLSVLRDLKEIIHRELVADIDEIDPDTNPGVPSLDTGELGVEVGYDTTNLTITVGISTSGFAKLGVSQPPSDLVPIDWAAFSDNPPAAAEGDLAVQICADSSYIVEHALRRIAHTLAGRLATNWALAGEQHNGADHGGRLTSDSARALIGFHDGLSNLDPRQPSDAQLIFVSQDGAP